MLKRIRSRKPYAKVQDEDVEEQGGPASISLPDASIGSTSRDAIEEYSYRSSGFVK
jgi:hypothetical protein